MDNSKIVDHLNDLIEYLYDSRNGYNESADETESSVLKDHFRNLANDRSDMINELKIQVTNLGGDAKDSGSMIAAAHRFFIDLKSMLTGHDDEAIINEIKRGESYTIDKYKEILEKDLPFDLKTLLNEQVAKIQANVARIDTKNTSII